MEETAKPELPTRPKPGPVEWTSTTVIRSYNNILEKVIAENNDDWNTLTHPSSRFRFGMPHGIGIICRRKYQFPRLPILHPGFSSNVIEYCYEGMPFIVWIEWLCTVSEYITYATHANPSILKSIQQACWAFWTIGPRLALNSSQHIIATWFGDFWCRSMSSMFLCLGCGIVGGRLIGRVVVVRYVASVAWGEGWITC